MTAEQSNRLFEVYYKCRFQDLIALDLMFRSRKLETVMLWFLLASISSSLLTGSIAFLQVAALAPVWATISVAATMASIYSLAAAPGEARFLHHDTARSFNSLALECENFTRFVAHTPELVATIDEAAREFHRRYVVLVERTGTQHREYGNKNIEEVKKNLQDILKAEKLVAEEAGNGQPRPRPVAEGTGNGQPTNSKTS